LWARREHAARWIDVVSWITNPYPGECRIDKGYCYKHQNEQVA